MMPTLKPGSVILASGVYSQLKVEDVVVVSHRGLDKVKRIQHYDNGRIYLTGDNAAYSTDSSSFGWLDENTVLGKVIWPINL